MSWFWLATAIAFELMGTTAMKFSEGFSRWLPTALVLICYVISFTFMSWSLKEINVSVAYAIWSGVGTAAIAVVGALYFHEPMTSLKVVSIGLIILGVVGLNLQGGH
jgi:small multidrug resistance pump